jgi:hypothetical protein
MAPRTKLFTKMGRRRGHWSTKRLRSQNTDQGTTSSRRPVSRK